MVSTKLMTAQELERMPDDDNRYELVQGELIRMRPTGFEHAEITFLIGTELNNFVRPRKLGVVGGEGGFILNRDPDTVRAPDVFFLRADRVPTGDAYQRFAGLAPDLAIEVRSPTDSMAELIAKVDEYLAAGTSLVWLFDPQSLTVVAKSKDGTTTTLEIHDELDGGDVLPGFRLPIRLIFSPR